MSEPVGKLTFTVRDAKHERSRFALYLLALTRSEYGGPRRMDADVNDWLLNAQEFVDTIEPLIGGVIERCTLSYDVPIITTRLTPEPDADVEEGVRVGLFDGGEVSAFVIPTVNQSLIGYGVNFLWQELDPLWYLLYERLHTELGGPYNFSEPLVDSRGMPVDPGLGVRRVFRRSRR